MTKFILTVHAEQETGSEPVIDTAYEGPSEKLSLLLSEAMESDPKLKMIVSRALYLLDDDDIQIADHTPDLVDLMGDFDNG